MPPDVLHTLVMRSPFRDRRTEMNQHQHVQHEHTPIVHTKSPPPHHGYSSTEAEKDRIDEAEGGAYYFWSEPSVSEDGGTSLSPAHASPDRSFLSQGHAALFHYQGGSRGFVRESGKAAYAGWSAELARSSLSPPDLQVPTLGSPSDSKEEHNGALSPTRKGTGASGPSEDHDTRPTTPNWDTTSSAFPPGVRGNRGDVYHTPPSMSSTQTVGTTPYISNVTRDVSTSCNPNDVSSCSDIAILGLGSPMSTPQRGKNSRATSGEDEKLWSPPEWRKRQDGDLPLQSPQGENLKQTKTRKRNGSNGGVSVMGGPAARMSSFGNRFWKRLGVEGDVKPDDSNQTGSGQECDNVTVDVNTKGSVAFGTEYSCPGGKEGGRDKTAVAAGDDDATSGGTPLKKRESSFVCSDTDHADDEGTVSRADTANINGCGAAKSKPRQNRGLPRAVHRRTRSGDKTAAALMLASINGGRNDWEGMTKDELPHPEDHMDEDDDDDDEDEENENEDSGKECRKNINDQGEAKATGKQGKIDRQVENAKCGAPGEADIERDENIASNSSDGKRLRRVDKGASTHMPYNFRSPTRIESKRGESFSHVAAQMSPIVARNKAHDRHYRRGGAYVQMKDPRPQVQSAYPIKRTSSSESHSTQSTVFPKLTVHGSRHSMVSSNYLSDSIAEDETGDSSNCDDSIRTGDGPLHSESNEVKHGAYYRLRGSSGSKSTDEALLRNEDYDLGSENRLFEPDLPPRVAFDGVIGKDAEPEDDPHEDRKVKPLKRSPSRKELAERYCPVMGYGTDSDTPFNKDDGNVPTFLCPRCRTRQREFFSVKSPPRQFDSPAGYLALYFGIYVIAALFIFGLEEGWEPLDCVYFSVITLTTAGLGDLVPTTDGAKVVCSIFIYFGVACIGLLLGSLLASSLDDQSEKLHREQLADSCLNCQRKGLVGTSTTKSGNVFGSGDGRFPVHQSETERGIRQVVPPFIPTHPSTSERGVFASTLRHHELLNVASGDTIAGVGVDRQHHHEHHNREAKHGIDYESTTGNGRSDERLSDRSQGTLNGEQRNDGRQATTRNEGSPSGALSTGSGRGLNAVFDRVASANSVREGSSTRGSRMGSLSDFSDAGLGNLFQIENDWYGDREGVVDEKTPMLSPTFARLSPMTPYDILNRSTHTRHISIDIGNAPYPRALRDDYMNNIPPSTGNRSRGRRLSHDVHQPTSQENTIDENAVYGEKGMMGNGGDELFRPYVPYDDDEVSGSSYCSSNMTSSTDPLAEMDAFKAARHVFLTLKQAVMNSILIIAIGSLGFHYIENLGAVDSFYFTTVLLTTVGYGDIVPKTPEGKMFATIYVLVAGTVLLHNMSMISMIPLELRKRRIERAVLTQFGEHLDDFKLRELATGPLVRRLQLAANRNDALAECTREMFALAMLVRLGRITERDVSATFAAFQRLDRDQDGKLNSKDIIYGEVEKRRKMSNKKTAGAMRRTDYGNVKQSYPFNVTQLYVNSPYYGNVPVYE